MNEAPLVRGTVAQLRPEPSQPGLPALQIHSGAMLASGASIGAVRLACDLIQFVWWPTQMPFSFKVDPLSARLHAEVPSRRWTPWRVRRYRAWAMTFFRDIGNDQWMPIANYYQLAKPETARQLTTAMRA